MSAGAVRVITSRYVLLIEVLKLILPSEFKSTASRRQFLLDTAWAMSCSAPLSALPFLPAHSTHLSHSSVLTPAGEDVETPG